MTCHCQNLPLRVELARRSALIALPKDSGIVAKSDAFTSHYEPSCTCTSEPHSQYVSGNNNRAHHVVAYELVMLPHGESIVHVLLREKHAMSRAAGSNQHVQHDD